MKKVILLSTFIFALGQLNAQITLTKSDYTATVGSAITKIQFESSSWSDPSEGADQVWDYTGLVLTDTVTQPLTAYSGPEYPEANISWTRISVSSSGGVSAPFERTDYESLDETEYGRVGVKYGATNIPLGAFTGNPADTVYFLENYGEWPNGTEQYAWFPMNYEDTRSSNFIQTLNNQLSIAAFGFDQTPGAQVVYGTHESEVAGWGNISLINPIDGSTVTFEALLLKTTIVEVDSFFTAGQPSPPQLLGALGLTQGNTETLLVYRFFAKGFPAPVLTLSDGHYQRGLLADLTVTTSTKDIQANFIPLTYYPNPVTDQLTLEFEKSTREPWVFSIYNSIGQKVFDYEIAQPTGSVNESIEFNQQFPVGNYFYVLHNGDRKVMSSGGLEMN